MKAKNWFRSFRWHFSFLMIYRYRCKMRSPIRYNRLRSFRGSVLLKVDESVEKLAVRRLKIEYSKKVIWLEFIGFSERRSFCNGLQEEEIFMKWGIVAWWTYRYPSALCSQFSGSFLCYVSSSHWRVSSLLSTDIDTRKPTTWPLYNLTHLGQHLSNKTWRGNLELQNEPKRV